MQEPLPTRVPENKKTMDEIMGWLLKRGVEIEKRDGDYYLRGQPTSHDRILQVANSHRRYFNEAPFVLVKETK